MRRSFEHLRDALARGDGDAVAARLSQRSFVWLAEARRRALHAPRAELAGIAPEERLAALALRQRAAPLLRREGAPRDLLVQSIDAGRLDPDQVRAATLGPVSVQQDQASALLRAGPLPAGLRARFVREEGAWKLDLGGSAASLRAPIRATARVTGASEDTVILRLLAAASGEPAGPGIWTPPAPTRPLVD